MNESFHELTSTGAVIQLFKFNNLKKNYTSGGYTEYIILQEI